MRDPFANYDAWLERPYQEMMNAGDDFVEWAEMEGYDLDDSAQTNEAEKAYHDYLDACAEEDAVNRHEAYLDRLEWEAEEIDDYFEEGW